MPPLSSCSHAEETLSKFVARGPHPVGIATADWAHPDTPERRLVTDIWYPAEAGSAGPPADHPLADLAGQLDQLHNLNDAARCLLRRNGR